MKKLVTFFSILLMNSFALLSASDDVHYGQLKSGAYCSVRFEEHAKDFYKIHYSTRDYTIEFVNQEFKLSNFKTTSEHFEKEGENFEQLLFPMSIFPKTYEISLTKIKTGGFQIKRTTLIFGNPTITKFENCLTNRI